MKRRTRVLVLAAALAAVAGLMPAGRHTEPDAAVHADELAAVNADDRLLDTLGSAVSSTEDVADDELAVLLLAWRREVEAEPMPAGWS